MRVLSDKKLLLLLLVLCGCVAAVMYPCLGNNFVNYDDQVYVINNGLIKQFNFSRIAEFFTSFHRSMYKPITLFSFALEYHFAGLNPFVFHLTNLIFHIFNTLLVFWFVLKLSQKREAALFCALVFGIHPMHVESVAWVSERKDMLFAHFYMWSLLSYVYYKEKGKAILYHAAAGGMILSLMVKPMGVSLPAVFLLLDYFQGRKIDWPAIKEKIIFFAIAAVFMVLAVMTVFSGYPIDLGLPPFAGFFIGMKGFVSYIWRFIYPVGVCMIHPIPLVITPEYFLYPVLSAACIGIPIYLCRNNKNIIFGLLFFTVTVFPGLQFKISTNSLAPDRYSYIAYIGLAYALWEFVSAYLIANMRGAAKAVTVAGLSLWLVFLAVSANMRCGDWRSTSSLWRDVIAKYPDSYYSDALRGKIALEEGREQEALEYFEKHLKENPYNGSIYMDLRDIYITRGEFGKAMEVVNRGAKYFPTVYMLKMRAIVHLAQDNYDLAIGDYTNAIALQPKSQPLYALRAIAYQKAGKPELARKDYNAVLEMNPVFFDAVLGLGAIELEGGNYEKALKYLSEAVVIDPDSVEAHAQKARACFETADYDCVVKEDTEGIRVFDRMKGFVVIKINLAALYAKRGMAYTAIGETEKALDDFKSAMAMDPGLAEAYYGKAVALAELSDYAQALQVMNKALYITPKSGKFYSGRGIIKMKKGDCGGAEADLYKALSLSPRLSIPPVPGSKCRLSPGLAAHVRILQ